MRVGIVCPYDLSAPGGVQQVAIELAGQLTRGGDEVVLIGAGRDSHASPGRDQTTVLVGRSVRIRGNDSIVPLTLSPLSWGRVRRALQGVDVVHIHEPLVPLVGWVTMTVRRPMVATFHADPPPWVSTAYRGTPFLARRMRAISLSAVSPTAAAGIPKTWGAVEVIPNAVDVSSYQVPVGRVERRVAFLGRDEPRKGLDVLLDAWPLVRERVPDAELRVMGADRGGGRDGVTYLGRVTSGEKNRILASSQIFVAPNTGGESFGVVLIEAMAAGCAVVCTELEAFRDVVGTDARVVPVGDVARLGDEIADLLTHPDTARALGESGRVAVAKYDWEVVVERYRELYRSAVT